MFGQLQKLGAKGLVKSWKKRIFVAKKDSRFVEYYRHYPDEAGPQGTIDLGDVTQVRPCENNLSLKKEKGEWAFEVITPDRVYYLLAPDEKTMQYWITGIQDVRTSLHLLLSSLLFNSLPFFHTLLHLQVLSLSFALLASSPHERTFGRALRIAWTLFSFACAPILALLHAVGDVRG